MRNEDTQGTAGDRWPDFNARTTRCHPDWMKRKMTTSPPLVSVPGSFPVCLGGQHLSNFPPLPSLPSCSSDSSNTLKKKCAKLNVAPGSSHNWSIAGHLCSPGVSVLTDSPQGPGEKDPKQLHHSEITANNQVFKEATKKNYQPHLRLHTRLSMCSSRSKNYGRQARTWQHHKGAGGQRGRVHYYTKICLY